MAGEKLPALLIFPDKGVARLKIDRPENVEVYHREEGSWVDRKVMKWYVENVLGPWSRKIPERKRGLLLIDSFEGHFSTEINAPIHIIKN